jgi:hypothetical protein
MNECAMTLHLFVIKRGTADKKIELVKAWRYEKLFELGLVSSEQEVCVV